MDQATLLVPVKPGNHGRRRQVHPNSLKGWDTGQHMSVNKNFQIVILEGNGNILEYSVIFFFKCCTGKSLPTFLRNSLREFPNFHEMLLC